jgi:hypothetical protein
MKTHKADDNDKVQAIEYAPIWECEFEFQCPNRWHKLRETKDQKIRHCEECKRDVHLCRTVKELKVAIDMGYCAAVPGNPDPDSVKTADLQIDSRDMITMGIPKS